MNQPIHELDRGPSTGEVLVPPKTLGGTNRKCRAPARLGGDPLALDRLRRAMKSLGWNSADIAAAWGIDRTAVDDILYGRAPWYPGDLESLTDLFDRYCELRLQERGIRPAPVMAASMDVIESNAAVNTQLARVWADGKFEPNEVPGVRHALVVSHEKERVLEATLDALEKTAAAKESR